ncbi:adhesive plaque matrix protein 2-like [Macrobrachium nipponense]|uniref:adhesive plaque matrix protein 2-like n=1 Tax=Macrobrachium nipponense TaxID=159736 RepID=UPI0030C7CD77
MIFMQRLFLLLLATVAFAKHATTEEPIAENAIAEKEAHEENVTAEEEASAENEIAEEIMSKEIDDGMIKLFGNETNGTMSYEEVEAKTFCGNTINNCHKSGGVCMTSYGIRSFGSSGNQCSSTKTFSSGNCQTCHCCIECGVHSEEARECKGKYRKKRKFQLDNFFGKLFHSPTVLRNNFGCKHKGGYCCGRDHCKTGYFVKKHCSGGYDCGCCIDHPVPEVCETTSECKHKGGYCCGRDHCKSGHFVKRHCSGGYDCGCCIDRPAPEVCETTSECKHKGGYCCGRDHCKSGHFVKRHCSGGYDCGCCIDRPDPEVCETTSECKHKGGYCCGRDHCKSGHFVKRHCSGGYDCGCCIDRPAPEVCETTSECKHKGGYCCGRDHCKSGHFVKRHCSGGRDCGCCLADNTEPPQSSPCQEKRSCKRAHGHCKSNCGYDEDEIHGGCRGSGCKCCAHKSSDNTEPPQSSTCQEEQSCKRSQGHCKSRCGYDESEIYGGCRGSGCKCCARKSHPSPYGRSIFRDDDDDDK